TALLLGGVVYFSELQRAQNQEATKTTKEPIFPFKEDEIQSVTINQGDKVLEFERVSGQLTNWRMKQPKDAPASDAAVAFLLNLLAEGKSDRSFPIQANQFQEFGLDQPMATVKIQLKNNKTHWLTLGKPDFNRSFIYAQANPNPQTPQQFKVLLVPIDFEYAVNRPMSEWQSQSEIAQSPSPSPTPESTQPSSTTQTPQPSPAAASPKPSPTQPVEKLDFSVSNPRISGSFTQTATPESAKPAPTSASPKPSPTAASPKPLPTQPLEELNLNLGNPRASGSFTQTATPESAKPAPISASPKPSPTVASPKPSPTQPLEELNLNLGNPRVSGSFTQTATSGSVQPAPTSASPKPSLTPPNAKPSSAP
ncbi:MAG TPA: DUF4340 domain-containing protein, partial [Coleofasciculaceae cyanobacterium]